MKIDNRVDLDAVDKRILSWLTQDARIPYSRLAEQLHVSNTLIHQRIKKLKIAGILTEAIWLMDPEKLGYHSSAYTQIILTHAKHLHQVVEELRKTPEVVECVNIAGRYALMVKIYARDNTHLRDIVYDRIQSIEGVEGTNTVFLFETSFIKQPPLPG